MHIAGALVSAAAAALMHTSPVLRPTRIATQARIVRMVDDDGTDWDAAMRSLRARSANQADDAAADDESDLPPPVTDASEGAALESPSPTPTPFFSAPPETGKQSPAGFGFETENDSRTTAGLDRNDEKLLRNATLIGGRLLTLITISSLVFYIYIGLSGGITDGFDRYTEPIEDIRTTMAREGMDARPDYNQPPGYGR